MADPITTGQKLSIAETASESKVPFLKGQIIFEDSGNMYYDPTTGSSQSDRIQCGGGTFSNSTPTTANLGGVSKGTTFDEVPVTDVLNMLLYPHVDATLSNPSISCSPTGTQEMGVSVKFTKISVTVTKGSANITSILIEDTTDTSISYTATADQLSTVNSKGSLTVSFDFDDYSIASGKSHSYKVTMIDKDNVTYTKTAQVSPTWVYPYYYGAIDASKTSLTQDEVKALTKVVAGKANQTLKFTMNDQKAAFCYPTSHGKLTAIMDQNNFNVTDTFSCTTVSVTANDGKAVDYYVYILNTASTTSNFSFTFKF